MNEPDMPTSTGVPGAFPYTHWSVVLNAGGTDTTQAHEALSRLCETYWFPLYAFVRRRGHSPEDAQDLTQGFFAQLIAHNWMARADRQKGRFRSFLLMAMNRFLAKDLGQPDANSDKRWLKWRKHFVHCLIDDAQGAFELRFDEGFEGSTTSGIKIGSPLKAALAAYGEPSSLKDNGVGKKLIWSSKGILIWFSGDKATQIVVFRKM